MSIAAIICLVGALTIVPNRNAGRSSVEKCCNGSVCSQSGRH